MVIINFAPQISNSNSMACVRRRLRREQDEENKTKGGK